MAMVGGNPRPWLNRSGIFLVLKDSGQVNIDPDGSNEIPQSIFINVCWLVVWIIFP